MAKEKSKAISPEVRGLFARIEKQADEYENAFDNLNKFFRDAERIRRENEELIIKHNDLVERNITLCQRLEKIETYINLRLQNVFQEIIKHLEVTVIKKINAKTNATLKDFEERAERAIGLIEGSTGIIQLAENLKELSKELEQKIFSVDERIAIIDNRIDGKFEELNQRDEELKKVNENFNFLKTQIEELLQETNQKISASINDSHQKLETMFNNMFNDTSFNLENRIKNTIVEVKNSQIIINQKIRNTDDKIDNFTEIAKKLELHLRELKESTQEVALLKLRVEEVHDDLMYEIESIIASSGNINNRARKRTPGFEITNHEIQT